jgi:protein O-GlcNAc transferase
VASPLASPVADPKTEMVLQDAMRLRRAGRLQEAAALYSQVLAANPGHYGALHAFGTLRYQSGDLDEAERLIGAAIAVNPQAPDALFNRGCLLVRLGRIDEAIAAFSAAIALKPDYVEALTNRGAAYLHAARDADALADYDALLRVQPQFAHAWHNRAIALWRLNRVDEARASYGRALTLDPYYAPAWIGRSACALKLGQTKKALADADWALRLVPGDAQAWEARGNALLGLQHWEDAIAAFDAAAARNPGARDAIRGRGVAAMQLRRFGAAIRDFEMVLETGPEDIGVTAELLFCRLSSCDWRGVAEARSALSQALACGTVPVNPFVALLLGDPLRPEPGEPGLYLQAARLTSAAHYPPRPPLAPRGTLYKHPRIRLGYLSADLRSHATALLMAGVFEGHDRTRFESCAFSYGADDGSPMRARLKTAFDRFIDVSGVNDAEAAQLLREMEIDIAIDLKAYTAGGRPGILAFRPAPIQVQYLGFPGSMGAEFMDYLIADRIVIPEEERELYTEEIVYLPHTYQANDGARPLAAPPRRAAEGLPEQGIVFSCFNNPYKIAPEIFAIWMRLLEALEGSVLWLIDDNEWATANLRREAEAYGIAPNRLILAPQTSADAHLARQPLADLFLDTLPVGAHTTASDALYAGVPVLTCRGGHFAGRVATSLLCALGLPELVTDSLVAYEAAALRLARDPAALALLRSRLASNRRIGPLFDTAAFTRHLEAAYAEMWERNRRGLPPAAFAVRVAGRA